MRNLGVGLYSYGYDEEEKTEKGLRISLEVLAPSFINVPFAVLSRTHM